MPPAPAIWPPLPLDPHGWLVLDARPVVDGPWTDQLRFALRVLDPLPGSAGSAGAGSAPTAPQITTVLDPGLPEEGYRLAITEAGITVAASTPRGALQAATTIRQLLPAEAWRATRDSVDHVLKGNFK